MPGEVAALLAREKARAVAARLPGRLVLGADQTLALGERRFSKPADRAAAREQLEALRGRTHELHTAIALVRDGSGPVRASRGRAAHHARLFRRASSTPISMPRAPPSPRASAATSWRRLGIQLFERIEGDHFTILGLPLLPLLRYARDARMAGGVNCRRL